MSFTLVKRNKRFFVEHDGEPVYSPPDFLRPYLQGRSGLQNIVDACNSGLPLIKAVVAFESAARRVKPPT